MTMNRSRRSVRTHLWRALPRATATLLLTSVFAGGALAQTSSPAQTPAPRTKPAPTPTPTPTPQTQIYFYGRPVMRLFQDYTLPQGDTVQDVQSILADVRIEGTVRHDVAVVMGSATIGPNAVIEGSLVVVGGSATIASGAKVRRDLVVIGGTLEAPADFTTGGEHVIIGTPAVGAWLRGLTPWLIRGPLLGRLIVPDIGWVWTVVGLLFLIGLFFNHVFARQVGACADTLTRRPVGSFFVGLLTIILAGPVIAIVAVTVIGLPFAIAAFVAASIIGKLGVTRVIGRSVVTETEPKDRAQAFRSYLIGSAILVVAFMIPVIGLLTWAIMGVFGFGTATMTFMSSLRKERPVPPAPVVPPPPMPPVPPPFVTPDTGAPVPGTAAAFVEDHPRPYSSLETPTPYSAPDHDAFRAEPPPIVPPAAGPIPPPFAAAAEAPAPATLPAPVPGDLTSYPRATFLDRLVAFALDAVLIAIVNNMLTFRFVYYHSDNSYLLWLFLYHLGFWAWKGTTLGGIICNLRMVRTNGETPRPIDALVRGLSAIFSVAALGIGCLWMLTDPQKQMWHDKFAGTIVVKLPRELVLT